MDKTDTYRVTIVDDGEAPDAAGASTVLTDLMAPFKELGLPHQAEVPCPYTEQVNWRSKSRNKRPIEETANCNLPTDQ